MSTIDSSMAGSAALQLIQQRGWSWKNSSAPNIELETCPYCAKGNYGHCYMEIHGAADEYKNRDGLHTCHRCGKGGSLYSLKEHLGITPGGSYSAKDYSANGEKVIEPMPDVEALHQALLEDEAAMDYLINGRGFSQAIIQQQKLGLTPKRYFRECGEVRALVYPYLVNGNCVFIHFRTLPTMPLTENKVPKAFASLKGWDAPLYNGGILQEGLTEVVFVEGEANCIAAMDKGVTNICGVPGANFKKAEWLESFDKIENIKIYICYDKDKVGQKAAQTLASRIGIEKCFKIVLPDFEVTTDEGVTRQGKDLNEWFTVGGGTPEAFQALKEKAELFDVDGVSSAGDALSEFEEEILGKGIEPQYKPKWKSLADIVGFDTGDVIDIMAPEKIGKTTFGLNLLEHMTETYGEDGIIICLEMTRAKLARKWLSHTMGIADNIPKTPAEAEILKHKFLSAIPVARAKAANRPGNLYLCYPQYRKVDDIYKLIVDCIRRYGVKWVMLDNLQRLCDLTLGGKNRTQHLSEISKITSRFAKDYGVQMVRIVQPHRIKDGQMVTTDDADGASQIFKDCDCAITLHRNRVGQLSAQQFETMPYVQAESSFDEKMLVTVGLSRYSSGGYTTLHYDGARSTVSEMSMGMITKIQADANKNVGYESQLKGLNIIPASVPGALPIPQDNTEITI